MAEVNLAERVEHAMEAGVVVFVLTMLMLILIAADLILLVVGKPWRDR